MIILVTLEEFNQKTGLLETIVSHGVDSETLRCVVMPQVDPRVLGARFDNGYGEWVLEDNHQQILKKEQDRHSRIPLTSS